MNWAMEKSLLAAYTPPLRNKSGAAAAAPDTPWGGLTRSYFVQGLSAAAGREEIGEGACEAPSPCP
mgnify:FL=1